MMKLTLLASLVLLSLVAAQCPANYDIPNLVAGTPIAIQIPCYLQSPAPRPTPPRHISTTSKMPSLSAPRSPSPCRTSPSQGSDLTPST